MNKDLIFIGDLRADGRKNFEIRATKIEMDIIKNSNGSAFICLGETQALAWVDGPKEGRSKNYENKGVLKCIFTIASFASLNRKSKDFKRDLKMREFSKTLKDIFEQVILLENYQKSEIVLNVLITQSDGSYKSAAINAATLALINAGILIKDTVIGMSLGLFQDRDSEFKTLYDLQLQEEKENIPLLNLAYLPHSQKFIFLELLNAKTPYAQSEILIREGEKASNKLFDRIEKFLKYEYIRNN
jgi:exosome complex component RRP41